MWREPWGPTVSGFGRFLDYLASWNQQRTNKLSRLGRFIGASHLKLGCCRHMNSNCRQGYIRGQYRLSNREWPKADKALYYGFVSHYLDFDDVLYSVLLMVLDAWYMVRFPQRKHQMSEGIINFHQPAHRTQGWHLRDRLVLGRRSL